MSRFALAINLSAYFLRRKSFLPKSENVIFTSPVVPQESRTLRQRASSLIPSVSPKKISPPSPKERQLVLTSNRILCLKLKSEKETTVKHEILFGGKRSSVEPKGERQFAVHGVSKSRIYSLTWKLRRSLVRKDLCIHSRRSRPSFPMDSTDRRSNGRSTRSTSDTTLRIVHSRYPHPSCISHGH